jgi:signal transduction histidine kinase
MSAVQTVRTLSARFGPRVRDLICIGVALLTTAAVTINEPPWPHLQRAGVATVGIAGSVALWWRRRSPVRVTLVGMVVSVAAANPVTMVVGLFSTAIRRRDRTMVALGLATSAAIALPQAVDRGTLGVSDVVGAVLVAGFVVAAGAYIGARRDLLASLRERAERAEAERELRAVQARVAERARIAREMHDVLAHKVSLIALHAGALEVTAMPTAERTMEIAALIRGTARQALEELREVLGMLRDDVSSVEGADLTPTSTAADIERLVAGSRGAGVQADLVDEVDEVDGLPDVTARTVYRVVQEALTNVHKHARGAATVVRLRGGPSAGVTVSVVNRRPVGAGTLLPGSGAGLVGLHERMRLVGGHLESGPTRDGGWQVTAWLPWAGSAVVPASGSTETRISADAAGEGVRTT